MKEIVEIIVKPGEVFINGEIISRESVVGLYRQFIGDYPKFFKMDSLCKLGFVASELLLRDLAAEQKENLALILFNKNGSLITDRNYQKTISEDNYFPSPALFVYTLANIVTGEIAIRHKIYGESSFYVLKEYNPELMWDMALTASSITEPERILTGWVDYENEDNYLAHLRLYYK